MTDYTKQVKTVTLGTDNLVSKSIELATRITDDEQNKVAANVLTEVKAKIKELKSKKSAILDPLNASIKEVRSLFADPEKRLSDAEAGIKTAMLAYHDDKEAAAQKKMDQINGRLDRGTMKVETGIAKLGTIDQADNNLQTDGGSIQIKQGPEKLRVTDAAKLIAAYPEILQSERVLEALRLEATTIYKQGTYVLPGTEIYRDKIVAGVAA